MDDKPSPRKARTNGRVSLSPKRRGSSRNSLRVVPSSKDAGGGEGTSSKRKATKAVVVKRSRSYTDREKFAAMHTALEIGVARTVEITGVPQRTLYHWFSDEGGLAEVRSLVQAQTEQSLSSSIMAICRRVSDDVKEIELESLIGIVRTLIESGHVLVAPTKRQDNGQVQAQAALYIGLGATTPSPATNGGKRNGEVIDGEAVDLFEE